MKPKPDKYEWAVAEVMANYFDSDISFIECSSKKSPDILIWRTRTCWEIKNIRGDSKFTIQNNLRKAGDQSNYVIISLLRARMPLERARNRINYFMLRDRRFRKILLVTKTKKVFVIK